MNCQTLHEYIDEYISGNITISLAESIDKHGLECEECATSIKNRKHLITLLNSMPKVHPGPELATKILSQRQANGLARASNKNNWLWFGSGVGSSIAAGVLLLLFFGFFSNAERNKTPSLNQVSILIHETSPVNILVNSDHQIDDVKFSVILPPKMQLQGYGSRAHLAWLGRLKQGRNLLSLPVMSSTEGSGTLIMRIEHQNSVKEYKLNIKVTSARQTTLLSPKSSSIHLTEVKQNIAPLSMSNSISKLRSKLISKGIPKLAVDNSTISKSINIIS